MITNSQYGYRGIGLLVITFFICNCLLFTTAVFAQSATLGSGTKGSGPVAYWNFDEAGGPAAYDQSGNNNSGTLNAGGSGSNTTAYQMWTPSGKFGGALEFDGANDSVSLGNILQIGTSSWTYSLWFKGNNFPSATSCLLSKTDNGATPFRMALCFDSNQKIYFILRDSANSHYGFEDSYVLPWTVDYNWHHIAIVINRSSYLYCYLDGVQIGSRDISAIAGQDFSLNRPFRIGSYNDGSDNPTAVFNGTIDDVRIYNRALSADEIKMAYNAGAAAHFGGGPAFYDPWGGNPPVAWWSFDENTGTTAYDRSGSGNNGTITEAAWAHGYYGNALSFDGANDYVDCGSDASLNMGNQITAEAWIYMTGGSARRTIATKWSSYFFEIVSGKLNVYLYGTTSQGWHTSNLSVQSNMWQHIAFVYDGANVKFYINGIEDGNKPATSGDITDNTNSLVIGDVNKFGQTRAFGGLIDDIRIYNYARTPAQIAWDYNKGKPVGHWNMDEAASGSAAGSANIKDSSGNGNDGSGTGTNITWTTGKYGGALSFNGTDDWVDCGSGASLNISSDITLEAWIYKKTSTGAQQIVGKNYFYRILFSGNTLRFYTSASNYISYPTAISLNTWHHVAATATYDGVNTTMNLYVDGIAGNPGSWEGHIMSSPSTTVKIGIAWAPYYYFNGLIDDVRIYNYARTPDQIRQDYNEGAAAHLGE